MFDKKESNRSAIRDFSQSRNSAFNLPADEKRTVKKDSNNNFTYMVFGILGIVVLVIIINLSITYLFTIRNLLQLMIFITVFFLVTAIFVKFVYPRKPIEKDGNEDDL